MADIVFKYPEMRQAVTDIQGIAARYKAAATTLESDFTAAISEWEGESKSCCRLPFHVRPEGRGRRQTAGYRQLSRRPGCRKSGWSCCGR